MAAPRTRGPMDQFQRISDDDLLDQASAASDSPMLLAAIEQELERRGQADTLADALDTLRSTKDSAERTRAGRTRIHIDRNSRIQPRHHAGHSESISAPATAPTPPPRQAAEPTTESLPWTARPMAAIRMWRDKRSIDRHIAHRQAVIDAIDHHLDTQKARVREALSTWKSRDEAAAVDKSPLHVLKPSLPHGVHLTALVKAGIRTIGQVPGEDRLKRIKGVGSQTAKAILQAIAHRRMAHAQAVRTTPDPNALDEPATEAVYQSAFEVLRDQTPLKEARAKLHGELLSHDENCRNGHLAHSVLDVLRGKCTPQQLEEAQRIARALARPVELPAGLKMGRQALIADRSTPSTAELGLHVQQHYSDYMALLEHVLGMNYDAGQAQAQQDMPIEDGADSPARQGCVMPAELVESIRSTPLDLDRLNVTLRPYQHFGAQFIRHQARTILADEMGLGKTIQALAAVSDALAKAPKGHALVVCPASLRLNWAKEIIEKTTVPPFILHGHSIIDKTHQFLKDGGIAIVSYNGLRDLRLHERLLREELSLQMLIGDEAHHVKNPSAQRTKAFTRLSRQSEQTCLLTGTPLENHVGEFACLTAIAQPNVGAAMKNAGDDHDEIRNLASGLYLRRRVEDVLHELPDKIETIDWIDLTPAERKAWNAAALNRHFMTLRQMTAKSPSRNELSSKVRRAKELVENAKAQNRKTLIFSYFRGTLKALEDVVNPIGVLHGDVPQRTRDDLCRKFNSATAPHTLLLQIKAGGQGLNLQGASVVILMEPALNPSTEHQAIARAHRMGQTQVVYVHRLIAEDTIDHRILMLNEHKQQVFDQVADVSELGGAAQKALEQSLMKEERRLAELQRAMA